MALVIEDTLDRAQTYDITGIIDPKDRVLHRDLTKFCDCPYPNATLDSVAEIQSFTPGDRTGGQAILLIIIPPSQLILTSTIWNEAASATQQKVDDFALTNNTVDKYIAGDIAITGGPWGAGGSDIIFTFSGESVRGNIPLSAIIGVALTGGTTDPVPSVVTEGIAPRFWFAALKAMGVLIGTDPAFGATPAGQYTVRPRDELENYPSNETLRKLVRECTFQEGQDWDSELLPLMNIKP